MIYAAAILRNLFTCCLCAEFLVWETIGDSKLIGALPFCIQLELVSSFFHAKATSGRDKLEQRTKAAQYDPLVAWSACARSFRSFPTRRGKSLSAGSPARAFFFVLIFLHGSPPRHFHVHILRRIPLHSLRTRSTRTTHHGPLRSLQSSRWVPPPPPTLLGHTKTP